MIVLRRQDGYTLNVSACRSTSQTKQGLVVEMGKDEYFLVPNYSIEQLAREARRRVESPGAFRYEVIIIEREWRGWP